MSTSSDTKDDFTPLSDGELTDLIARSEAGVDDVILTYERLAAAYQGEPAPIVIISSDSSA